MKTSLYRSCYQWQPPCTPAGIRDNLLNTAGRQDNLPVHQTYTFQPPCTPAAASIHDNLLVHQLLCMTDILCTNLVHHNLHECLLDGKTTSLFTRLQDKVVCGSKLFFFIFFISFSTYKGLGRKTVSNKFCLSYIKGWSRRRPCLLA